MASNPDTFTHCTITLGINYRTDKYSLSPSESMIQTIHEITASDVARKLKQAFESLVNTHKPRADTPITNVDGYRGTDLIKYKVTMEASKPLENGPHQHQIPVCIKIRHRSNSMFPLDFFETTIAKALPAYDRGSVDAVKFSPLSRRLASLSLFRPIQANQDPSPVPRPSTPGPEQGQWTRLQTQTRTPVERKMTPRPSTPTPEQWQWTPPEDIAAPKPGAPTS